MARMIQGLICVMVCPGRAVGWSSENITTRNPTCSAAGSKHDRNSPKSNFFFLKVNTRITSRMLNNMTRIVLVSIVLPFLYLCSKFSEKFAIKQTKQTENSVYAEEHIF